ncbi:MAG: RNA polymerase sigma factor, partial [Vicinamibacteria bacterium]
MGSSSLAYAPNLEASGEADKALVVRARGGDADAFAEIVRSYQRRIYRVAMRMTRRHDVADDVTQDTFLRAYRNLGRFELGRPLLPWLTRIAVNLSINYLNGVTRREQPLYTEDQPGGPEPGAPGEEPIEMNPQRRLESEELARELDLALSRLSVEHRTVFLHKVVEGMQYQ